MSTSPCRAMYVPGGTELSCLHCGAKAFVANPMELHAYVRKLNEFLAQHGKCKKPVG